MREFLVILERTSAACASSNDIPVAVGVAEARSLKFQLSESMFESAAGEIRAVIDENMRFSVVGVLAWLSASGAGGLSSDFK